MYIAPRFVYMNATIGTMPTSSKRAHKHFQLDPAKIKRAQRALHAKTETEAIERALDFAITEHKKNRVAIEANESFLHSGIALKDLYGKLAG